MVFSGFSKDKKLLEIVENKKHKWFLAVQFHPELKSKPFKPHPIFQSFIKNSLDHKNG
jgi:CTP synthase